MKQGKHEHSHRQNRYAVLPTPVRLASEGHHTGEGVTIAFIDSGFYRHPDLTEPGNRIIKYVDITQPGALLTTDGEPESWQWHGTQTSVVACGNGHLSKGDVIIVPAGTPHWFKEVSVPFNYYVVKAR